MFASDELLKRIDGIFKGWNSTYFVLDNKERSKPILETIVKIVDDHGFDLSEYELHSGKFIGSCFAYEEKFFNFFTDNSQTENDVIWIVYHEFGHYKDFSEGRIRIDSEYSNLFLSGQKINMFALHAIRNRINRRYSEYGPKDNEFLELLNRYHENPLEASANTWARLHCPVVPDSVFDKTAYLTGERLVKYYET